MSHELLVVDPDPWCFDGYVPRSDVETHLKHVAVGSSVPLSLDKTNLNGYF